jgi:hypothetical protein
MKLVIPISIFPLIAAVLVKSDLEDSMSPAGGGLRGWKYSITFTDFLNPSSPNPLRRGTSSEHHMNKLRSMSSLT